MAYFLCVFWYFFSDLEPFQRVFCGVFELPLITKKLRKMQQNVFFCTTYNFCPFVLRFDFLGVRDISVEERVYAACGAAPTFVGYTPFPLHCR
jgi:hypothetical protein